MRKEKWFCFLDYKQRQNRRNLMTNLKVVETTKNTEILDNLIEEYNKTLNQLTNLENSVGINRMVQPDEENFQNVKNAINTLLGIKMKKERGSLKLMDIVQEIILVPENDEEKFKIDVLKESLTRIRATHLETDNLDKLFSNYQWVQNYRIAGEYRINSQKLNLINPFVTSAFISKVKEDYRHPRLNTVVFSDYSGLQNEISNTLSNLHYYGRKGGVTIEKGDYQKIARKIDMDYKTDWDFDDVDAINAIPSKKLTKFVDDALMKLDAINWRLNEYVKEVSMSASEFFGLLSDKTIQELDKMVADEKEEILRKSQCVRKTVNVDLSFNMDIELDTLGDIEDIKKVITEKIQNQIGRMVTIGFGWNRYNHGNHIESKSETLKLNGVEVISEMEKVA
jgi:hypothetical protein